MSLLIGFGVYFISLLAVHRCTSGNLARHNAENLEIVTEGNEVNEGFSGDCLGFLQKVTKETKRGFTKPNPW